MGNEEVQSEILQRLTRVETKLDMQLNAKDIANDALGSAKSASIRLNEYKIKLEEVDRHFDNEIKSMNRKIESEVKEIGKTRDTDIKELKLDRRWLIGTLITVGCLIVAVVTLAMKVSGM
ncbi:hypothetical protein EHS13_03095 [Paenibacillus psychroresistens]|uniref:Uncharacterized protein n=1 Tax=Paenibacillus psychroresistens TaxID=1778678 RepID=A0A6B8RER2_9BACL|nr:hypothetical protein [Paenibacillus psychroresistens]QGQ93962.1 hypothetical protein EHS13_03095 [Paenibacillus psychroresistens]